MTENSDPEVVEDRAVLMCMRVENAKKNGSIISPNSVEDKCSDCGVAIWVNQEMFNGRDKIALNDGVVHSLPMPPDIAAVCGPCAIKAADEEGDWAAAAQLRHMVRVTEGDIGTEEV